MAINLQARLLTVSYPKGTFSAPRGLIDYLFGTQGENLSWEASTLPADPLTGRKRRKYGTRQRSSAKAGEAVKLVLKTGEIYGGRITGTHTAFIDQMLAIGLQSKIANVYSERGTIYGPNPKKAAVPS